MLLMIIFILVLAAAWLFAYSVVPSVYNRMVVVNEKRQDKLRQNMEMFLPRHEVNKLNKIFIYAPIVFVAGFVLLSPAELRFYAVILGLIAGFIFPGIYLSTLAKKTKEKFNGQLVDALMIMSSSFKGGLSLLQAMEAVVDEMPDPVNREFGIVLGENKMGVSLEEALQHLYNRMPSNALQQMITAILLARETGGNLPEIFSRIAANIRENRKIQQNLDTLTIQGKIQGVVMSLLPIGFGFVVFSANRRIFEHMFHSDLGRMLLIYALISEVVGAFLIWKISTFKDF